MPLGPPAPMADERARVQGTEVTDRSRAAADQAAAVMTAARTLSLLAGIRTEEARALHWSHLALPATAVHALRAWQGSQAAERLAAGDGWQDTGLVFTSHQGAALDAANVRRMLKRISTEAASRRGSRKRHREYASAARTFGQTNRSGKPAGNNPATRVTVLAPADQLYA